MLEIMAAWSPASALLSADILLGRDRPSKQGKEICPIMKAMKKVKAGDEILSHKLAQELETKTSFSEAGMLGSSRADLGQRPCSSNKPCV